LVPFKGEIKERIQKSWNDVLVNEHYQKRLSSSLCDIFKFYFEKLMQEHSQAKTSHYKILKKKHSMVDFSERLQLLMEEFSKYMVKLF